MSSDAFAKFTDSLERDIVIVEDSANALGRSLSLGAVILNRLTSNSKANNIIILSSEVYSRVQERFLGFKIKKIESVRDVMDQLEQSEEVVLLHSITPILIRASIHQIVLLFRESYLIDLVLPKVFEFLAT